MVPLGGHPAPASTPAAALVSASSSAPAEVSRSTDVPTPGVEAQITPVEVPAGVHEGPGLEDLLEVWPNLTDELLESDREAWNAVRQVQPLALDGDVFTIGLATKSDLGAFKTSGAGPLRRPSAVPSA